MKKLHLICNAHIDPVWQWTWDEGISAAIATFKSACDLADEYDYIFCHNESILYEQIERICPELFERIKKLVKAGKWKIMGGWYIQPDCLMPSGESMVRQIQVGHEYFKKKFDVIPEIAVNFDSFGHSIGLVQILAKSGYKGYVANRPYKNQMDYPNGKFYRWVSPSGDSVLFSNFKGYGSLLGDAANKISLQAKEAEDVDAVLWGVGNHGGGASRKDLNDIKDLKIDDVKIFHSSLEDLFNDNIKISAEINHSLVTCMPGCYSSMVRIKQAHRDAENLLYSTEKLLALASLAGYKVDTADLIKAQKKLLLAEFHDILPGTCIADGEANGLELLDTCKSIVKDYRTNAFMFFATGETPAKEGEYPIFVFNPHPYELTAPIEVEYMLKNQNWTEYHLLSKVYLDGKEIPSQEIKEESNLNLDWRKKIIFEGCLKPMSITRFSVFNEKVKGFRPFDKPSVSAKIKEILSGSILKDEVSLELYDDTADPWGMSEKELRNGVGERPVQFRLMTEKESRDFIASDDDITPIHKIEDGDVLTSVEAFYKCGNSNAVVEYRKYKNHQYIDLKVTIEYVEKNKCIKLKIPVDEGLAIGDGPYVIEEKPINGELSFQKWLGVKGYDGEIFVAINDGVYAGQIKRGYIYFTLLRGAGYCMHPLPIDSEGTIAGERKLYATDRYLPRIENGRYVFRFRIMKGNVEEITEQSEEFNQKPYAINVFPIGTGYRKSDIHTDKHVIMPAAKTTADGGIIMRFFNPKGNDETFTLFVNGNNSVVKMKKYEIVTIKYLDGKFSALKNLTE